MDRIIKSIIIMKIIKKNLLIINLDKKEVLIIINIIIVSIPIIVEKEINQDLKAIQEKKKKFIKINKILNSNFIKLFKF